MPNLDLESLKRLLALEEASLASGFAATASDGSSSSGGNDQVPMMQSLRSPTTRTLMYILQNRSAHNWISQQFDAAKAEGKVIEEVAQGAEELLKDPLATAFRANVQSVLHDINESRQIPSSSSDGVTSHLSAAPPVAASGKYEGLIPDDETYLDDERKKRSQYSAVAVAIQADGRQCIVHGASVEDEDVQHAGGICFVLPKNEAGSVLRPHDPSKSSDDTTTTTKDSSISASHHARRKHDEDANVFAIDAPITQLIPLSVLAQEKQARDNKKEDVVLSSKATLQKLLQEQAELHKANAVKKGEYTALLDGLQRWQTARNEAFDVVLNTPVPYTTV